MSIPFRFIHGADLHLDSPFRGLAKAPEHVRERLVQSTFKAVRRMTEVAIREQIDFIVLAGDLFDESDRSLRAQLMLVREWEKLAEHGIAVYVIHGNHDPMNGKRAALKLPSNVHIFGAEEVEYRPAYRRSGELAAFIYGISYGSRSVSDNLAARYRKQAGAPFHIALLHANVDGDSSHDPYAPCSLDQLIGGEGFDYWALGHIHQRRVLHEYPHVVYAGNTQGRNPRETGAKGCYIVEVSAARAVRQTFIALDEVRWLEEVVPIDAVASEHELLLQLESAIQRLAASADGRAVMARLRLSGRGILHERLADPAVVHTMLEQLQEQLRSSPDYVYALDIRTGAALDWDKLAGEDSFAGELLRLSERLAGDEAQWRMFAADALHQATAHPKLSRRLQHTWEELPERWLVQARELALGLIAKDEDGDRDKDRD